MYEFYELTYVAIITVKGPELDEPVKVSVKLLPPDKIALLQDSESAQSDGFVYKRLQDCTLQDLREYADIVEAQLAADYDKITMLEVANSPERDLAITIVKDDDQPLAPAVEWLKNAIVLPQLPPSTSTLIDEVPVLDDDNLDLPLPVPIEDVPVVVESEAVELTKDTDPFVSDSRPEPAEVEEIEIIDDQAASDREHELDNTYTEVVGDSAVAEPAEPIPTATAKPGSLIDSVVILSDTEPIHEEREVNDGAEPAYIQQRASTENRLAGMVMAADDPYPAACDILLDENVLRDMQTHASSSMRREVAGMLIGPQPEKQPNGRYVVHVTDMVIAQHTRMQGASVTYTPESWRYVNDVVWERYPNEECIIVGWYHTHPGFGIFLSNMDLFIHHNFFTQKWHIAYVLDPVAQRSGFFTWDRQQSQVMAYNFPWPYWAHSSW